VRRTKLVTQRQAENALLQPPSTRPWVATPNSVGKAHRWFVIATLPVLAATLLVQIQLGQAGTFAVSWLALSIVVLAVSLAWHLAFATTRHRPLDSAWVMHGWLFCLLAPPDLSLPLATVGISFGVVMGSLIFGGTGRYLVSPALLGIVFVSLSYPAPLDAALANSGWGQIIAAQLQQPTNWGQLALLQTTPTIAEVSAVACLFGALLLYWVEVISLRIVFGALLGAAVAAYLVNVAGPDMALSTLPPLGHWISGSFAFCIAFIATDPTAAATTRPGRWLYGGLVGVLTVALRIFNPEHPEGTYSACLLASLFAPLIDHACVSAQLRRKRLAGQR
jgi:Na+-transporting NADH:ubiquinone oxidoreductase subunit B